MELWYVENDNVVELAGVRNETSGIVDGVVGSGSSLTSVVAGQLLPPPTAIDQYAGRTLEFLDATQTAILSGRHATISANTIAGVLTVPALVAAPASGDRFRIVDYLNAATVQLTIRDAAGANVAGQTWPLVMAYVAGSRGIYRATPADAIAIVAGRAYTAIITVVSGSLNGKWEMSLRALTRT